MALFMLIDRKNKVCTISDNAFIVLSVLLKHPDLEVYPITEALKLHVVECKQAGTQLEFRQLTPNLYGTLQEFDNLHNVVHTTQ